MKRKTAYVEPSPEPQPVAQRGCILPTICPTPDLDCIFCPYFQITKPQPEPMPLIPTREECQQFMTGWKDVTEAYQKGSDLYSWLFNIMHERQQAHDRQVRREAVKKFAEECRKKNFGFWSAVYESLPTEDTQENKCFISNTALEKILAHLRAMAEGGDR